MEDQQKSFWQEIIVDHSQYPRKHGRLKQATEQATGENPICGDRVRLELQVDKAGKIQDVRFEATGCAISSASASLLAANISGLSRIEAESLFNRIHRMITEPDGMTEPMSGELEALKLVRDFPLRVKCATLCWHALHHALRGGDGPVSTESG